MSQLQKLIRKLRPRSPSNVHSRGVAYRKLNDAEDELYTAIQRHDTEQLLKILNDENRNVNVVPYRSNKPAVLLACEEGYLEGARILLERGAKVNDREQPDVYGATPLIVASTLGHCELVKFLLDNGADVDCVCNQSAPGVVQTESFAWDMQEMLDPHRLNTPLIQACREGHLDVVKELLRRGCDVNAQNANGNTALHVSCLGRTVFPYSTTTSQFVASTLFLRPDVDIVEELLKHGARPNIQNHESDTVIQRVFHVRCHPALRMLGWQFTQEENNDILIRIFKVLRLLLQYGCNLPRAFWMHLKQYHDPDLAKEMMTMVKFSENFGLLPEVFPVIEDTMLFSLDNGCQYDLEDVSSLTEYDPGFQDLVDRMLPLVSSPRPLKAQCRTFIRSLLGSLHGDLRKSSVNALNVPGPIARYILGIKDDLSSSFSC